jgi:hypothetical protein
MINKLLMGVLAAAFLAAGCGSSDDTNGDGGVTVPDGGFAADGPALFGLSRGTNDFTFDNVVTVGTDGCGIDPMMDVSKMSVVSVTYDMGSQVVSIGRLVGTPMAAVFGSGKVAATEANKATLTRDNVVALEGMLACTWAESVTAQFELIDNDKFTLAVTFKDSKFDAKCSAGTIPTGGMCTSTWTWTLSKKK